MSQSSPTSPEPTNPEHAPAESTWRVCAVQMNSQLDIEQNLADAKQAIARAVAQGARLVVLPENVCRMGRQQDTAERFDELSQTLASFAEQYEVHLVAGTLPCPYRPDGSPVADGRVRQVSQLFAPDGTRLARYDKIHLFTALVDDSTGSYDESKTFEAGTALVTAPLDLGEGRGAYHLGMMVCFDLRFPALAQRLRQMGAELLSAPSAFTFKTGEAHWSLLLRARALDSQCLVIGSAQGGKHQGDNASRQTWGHASLAKADGTLIADTDCTDLPIEQRFALALADFDPAAQQTARRNLPLARCHRLG